jgi:hypothetical protein
MLDALFSGNAPWFTIPALVGTAFLGLRILLLLIGVHGMHMGDHSGDIGGHSDGHTDAMQLFSVQSIMGFIMGFGWGGFAPLKAGLDMYWVILIALGVGMLFVVVQLLLFRAAFQLQSSGNVAIDRAMGTQGVVYVEIPGGSRGKGQVTVVIDDKQRILNAITPDESIPSKTRVNVVGVNPDNTITVRRAT